VELGHQDTMCHLTISCKMLAWEHRRMRWRDLLWRYVHSFDVGRAKTPWKLTAAFELNKKCFAILFTLFILLNTMVILSTKLVTYFKNSILRSVDQYSYGIYFRTNFFTKRISGSIKILTHMCPCQKPKLL